jgi:hypothetical protein
MAASHTFSKLVDVTPIPLAETLIHEALDRAQSALPEASFAGRGPPDERYRSMRPSLRRWWYPEHQCPSKYL